MSEKDSNKKEDEVARIYWLADPKTDELRYVGWTCKSLKQRLYSHLYVKDKEKSRKSNWIRLLKRNGSKPTINLLQEVPLKDFAKAEMYWIDYFRKQGCNLTNATDGGEGTVGFSLKDFVEERRFLGYYDTDKWKNEAERLRSLRRNVPNTDEAKRKISEKLKGRIFTEEHKAKQSEGIKKSWIKRKEILIQKELGIYVEEVLTEQEMTKARKLAKRVEDRKMKNSLITEEEKALKKEELIKKATERNRRTGEARRQANLDKIAKEIEQNNYNGPTPTVEEEIKNRKEIKAKINYENKKAKLKEKKKLLTQMTREGLLKDYINSDEV